MFDGVGVGHVLEVGVHDMFEGGEQFFFNAFVEELEVGGAVF